MPKSSSKSSKHNTLNIASSPTAILADGLQEEDIALSMLSDEIGQMEDGGVVSADDSSDNSPDGDGELIGDCATETQTHNSATNQDGATSIDEGSETVADLDASASDSKDLNSKDLDSEDSDSIDIPSVLPGIHLTVEQWQILKELDTFVKGRRKLHLLTGYAGTGKTTLLQALIKQLRKRGDRRKIVLTAFSNKATKVLDSMATHWGLNVDAITCCKLLGLKPDIDNNTGKQIFKPDPSSENIFDRYRLVIVDEASMINEEMWHLLTEAVADLHQRTQILFVGDVAQLPPIGEKESKTFSEIYDRSDLTHVVRYGGAIGVLAESIRNQLGNR